MSIFDLVIAVLENTWESSAALMKYLFVFLIAFGTWKHHGQTGKVLSFAFYDAVLKSGPYVVSGFFLGGIAHLFLPHPAVLFSLPLIAFGLFVARDLRNMDEPDTPSTVRIGIFGTITALVLAALILDATVLNSLVALMYYAILFWEL